MAEPRIEASARRRRRRASAALALLRRGGLEGSSTRAAWLLVPALLVPVAGPRVRAAAGVAPSIAE